MNTPEATALGALEHLRHNQRQLDQDGCEVGVSRQALDEVLSEFAERDERVRELLSDPHGGEPLSERRLHIIKHDYQRLADFFNRYALGSKLPPSCIVCGYARPFAITHGNLPDIGVCFECRDSSPKSRAVSGDDKQALGSIIQKDELGRELSNKWRWSLVNKILTAGFRRPLESSRTDSAHHVAPVPGLGIDGTGVGTTSLPSASPAEPKGAQVTDKTEAWDMRQKSAEPPDGYLTGSNPNGGFIDPVSIVGGTSKAFGVGIIKHVSSPAEPVKVAGREALVSMLVEIACSVCEPEQADEKANAHTRLVLTRRFAAALLASGILNGKTLHWHKLAKCIFKLRGLDGLNSWNEIDNDHPDKVECLIIAYALCADTADIWTEE